MGFPRCAVCHGTFDHGTVGASVGVLSGEVVGLVLFHNASSGKLHNNNGQLCNGVKGILKTTKGIDSKFALRGGAIQWSSVTGRVEDVVRVLDTVFKRWSRETAGQLRDMKWICQTKTKKRERQIDVREARAVCASLGGRCRRVKVDTWYYVQSGRVLLRVPRVVNALLEKHGYDGVRALALLLSVMEGRYWVKVCWYLKAFAPGTMESLLPGIKVKVDELKASKVTFTANTLLPLMESILVPVQKRMWRV